MRSVVAIALLIASAPASAVDLEIGLALHPAEADQPEIRLSNPLGIVRVTQPIGDRLVLFGEHVSSLPDLERGYGLNMIGVMVRFRVK